jgi:hypothetical protein
LQGHQVHQVHQVHLVHQVHKVHQVHLVHQVHQVHLVQSTPGTGVALAKGSSFQRNIHPADEPADCCGCRSAFCSLLWIP